MNGSDWLGANPQTPAYAATWSASIATSLRCSVRSGSVLPFLAMPGIRFTPGSTGSAALSIVGSALGWPSMVR